MAKKPQSPVKGCIFCGCTPLSKEHFWPNWANALLKHPGGTHRVEHSTKKHKSNFVAKQTITKRPGQASSFKLRIVCTRCNNGWMSSIEESTKPILSNMIAGDTIILSIQAQRKLSEWIILKMLIAEYHLDKTPISTREELAKFKQTKHIPDNLKIWIASCKDISWQSRFITSSLYLCVSGSPTVNDAPLDAPDNTQSISIGAGKLFIHVLHTTVRGLELDMNVGNKATVIQLWPSNGVDIFWPPIRDINAIEADYVASSLERFFDSSHNK